MKVEAKQRRQQINNNNKQVRICVNACRSTSQETTDDTAKAMIK